MRKCKDIYRLWVLWQPLECWPLSLDPLVFAAKTPSLKVILIYSLFNRYKWSMLLPWSIQSRHSHCRALDRNLSSPQKHLSSYKLQIIFFDKILIDPVLVNCGGQWPAKDFQRAYVQETWEIRHAALEFRIRWPVFRGNLLHASSSSPRLGNKVFENALRVLAQVYSRSCPQSPKISCRSISLWWTEMWTQSVWKFSTILTSFNKTLPSWVETIWRIGWLKVPIL